MQNSLNTLFVPISRLEPETAFAIGRATAISRDEVKFSRFIDRLRIKFSRVFDDIFSVEEVKSEVEEVLEEDYKNVFD